MDKTRGARPRSNHRGSTARDDAGRPRPFEVPLPADIREGSLTLNDGRSLAYLEVGREDAPPVLFHHGGNDSRLAARLFGRAIDEVGVRIIAPDRPGFGRSDPHPGRTLLAWAADAVALLDALGVRRLPVIGHSGGGPHAMALAFAAPERIRKLITLAGGGPADAPKTGMHPIFRLVSWLMRTFPSIDRKMTISQAHALESEPERFLSQWARLSAADGAVFEADEVRARLLDEMREAHRQGPDGIVADHGLYYRPWGFDVAAIAVPTELWIGSDDRQAARGWAHWFQERIPGAELRVTDGDGHVSVVVRHAAAILRSALSAA